MQAFSHLKLLAGTALISTLLAGCAPIPQLGKLMEPNAPTSYASARTLGQGQAAWPSAGWWQRYNDDQLNALMNEALANSPTLAEAAARTKQAMAIGEQAQSALWPQLTANGNLTKTKQSYNQGVPADFVPKGFQWTPRATLDLNYQLDFFGRNSNAVKAATSEVEAAMLDQHEAALTLSANVAEAYANLAQLYADRDAASDALSIRNKTAGLFSDRLKQGLENEGSYAAQESAAAAAQAEIDAVDEQIALAKNRLAALTGAGPDRALSIGAPAKNILTPQTLPANIPADLMGRRPDLMAARLRVEAAASGMKVAKAGFYPNLNLSAYLGHQSLGDLSLFTKSGSAIGMFGPALSLPIFDAGRLAGQYRQTAAEYELSVAQYNGTIVRALNEIADAAESRKALNARLSSTRKALGASEKAYTVAMNRYKGGLSTYLDVLRAEDGLVDMRRALADLKARAFVLDVAMVRALGGGFDTSNMTSQEGQ